MNYLDAEGPIAKQIAELGWGFIMISFWSTVIVTGFLLIALFKRRPPQLAGHEGTVTRSGAGLTAVYSATALSSLVLLGSAVWMVSVTAAVIRPSRETALTIQVIGHQWWWEFRYLSPDTKQSFVTANEMRLPAGEPVRLELMSADVIHSFWLPKLAGKTDLIPGQKNITWIEAPKPGVYRGQCTEFCGLQHASMLLRAVAEPREAFGAWWKQQMRSSDPPTGGLAKEGQAVFTRACASCHAVSGTEAKGTFGPDLTHLMSRAQIGSNLLPNTRAYRAGWIADAPSLKPGVRMPPMTREISGRELQAVLAYIETLH
ncbi:MAG: cytochrome c oxidase subunit II [Hyphomicrobiaceae bacterium]